MSRTVVDRLYVRPPSTERDIRSAVPLAPAPLAVQTTTISGKARASPTRGEKATRGGCSPLTRASPGVEFTRTGAANVAPPSRLAAAYTSVVPSGSHAAQAATTCRSTAARDTCAFARPGTASVNGTLAICAASTAADSIPGAGRVASAATSMAAATPVAAISRRLTRGRNHVIVLNPSREPLSRSSLARGLRGVMSGRSAHPDTLGRIGTPRRSGPARVRLTSEEGVG